MISTSTCRSIVPSEREYSSDLGALTGFDDTWWWWRGEVAPLLQMRRMSGDDGCQTLVSWFSQEVTFHASLMLVLPVVMLESPNPAASSSSINDPPLDVDDKEDSGFGA